jgi:hypothetical protein
VRERQWLRLFLYGRREASRLLPWLSASPGKRLSESAKRSPPSSQTAEKESGCDHEGEDMSIRLEAAIELARSILDGKTDYMTQSEEVYKVIAWRIILAVQKDERAQFTEMRRLQEHSEDEEGKYIG